MWSSHLSELERWAADQAAVLAAGGGWSGGAGHLQPPPVPPPLLGPLPQEQTSRAHALLADVETLAERIQKMQADTAQELQQLRRSPTHAAAPGPVCIVRYT